MGERAEPPESPLQTKLSRRNEELSSHHMLLLTLDEVGVQDGVHFEAGSLQAGHVVSAQRLRAALARWLTRAAAAASS